VAVLLAAVVKVVVAAVAVAVAVVVAGAVESTLTLFFGGEGEWGNVREKTQTTCKASSWPALKNGNTRSVM